MRGSTCGAPLASSTSLYQCAGLKSGQVWAGAAVCYAPECSAVRALALAQAPAPLEPGLYLNSSRQQC